MGLLQITAMAMPTSQAIVAPATAAPASFRVVVLRQRGGDECDEERERREADGPVDQRNRARRQRDRSQIAG